MEERLVRQRIPFRNRQSPELSQLHQLQAYKASLEEQIQQLTALADYLSTITDELRWNVNVDLFTYLFVSGADSSKLRRFRLDRLDPCPDNSFIQTQSTCG